MSSNVRLSDKNTSNGFLSGFVESSVEMPADGLNGECIVHYGGEHSKYEMIVRLVDGKREGEAMIVNDGVPFLRLGFKQGSLTGVVERLSEYGLLDMRGHLEDGMESGLFVEFNRNKEVVWRGYYRNGQRFLEVRNRVANQDDGNGEFYELDENGNVTQLCLYVNGARCRVIQKFNGEVMTEYDENGKKVYEGEFSENMENGFVREGKGKEFVNGSRMAVYSGDWKNGKREGMGTEYKGFKPVYTGEWRNGKREGKGEEMDENGEVVRSGWWMDGIHESEIKPILIPSSLTPNPQTIEELRIENNSYNNSSVTEFKLIRVIHLKRIVIGDDCFGKVRVVELDGLNELESVVIGACCFTHAKTLHDIWNHVTRTDGVYRIVNCPTLQSIRIGDWSFCDHHSFELNNLPSLQSIDIGEHCFCYAPSFSLTGLID